MKDLRLVAPFNWFLIGLVALATICGLALVPLDGVLPIHWGFSGEADGFAPAPIALMLPLAMIVVVLALLFAIRRARMQTDFQSGRFVIDATIGGLAGIALVIETATVLIGLGQSVDVPRLICMAVTALFVVVGNVLPKTRQNWVAGIRLPWTLRDADNWRVTHRWAGRAMVVFGLIGFLLAALGPTVWSLFAAVFGAAFVPILIGIGVSYGHAMRHGETRAN